MSSQHARAAPSDATTEVEPANQHVKKTKTEMGGAINSDADSAATSFVSLATGISTASLPHCAQPRGSTKSQNKTQQQQQRQAARAQIREEITSNDPYASLHIPRSTDGVQKQHISQTGMMNSRVASHLSAYNAEEWASDAAKVTEPSTHMDTVTNFQPFSEESPALRFTVHATCGKARASTMELPHGAVPTPVFMPVGTQGTIKGLCAKQVENTGVKLILGNTYHLGVRPGTDIIHHKGGLHQYMNWNYNMLSDSGGFQMVSLVSFTEISETGVSFQSPVDGSKLLLTPERSIQYQNELGTDILMALDDVPSSLITGPRVEEAMLRSIRWLDRCIAAHKKPHIQNLFAIIQGSLFPPLRIHCLEEMIKRNTPGYAIGGLAGGEDKHSFWTIVKLCTDYLPKNKPRYLMGVGYPIDLLVCVALGVDMFDCVWPCRTARFGTAIAPDGLIKIHRGQYANDHSVLVPGCPCQVCSEWKFSRSYLHHVATKTSLGCHLLTIHNIGYLKWYMDSMRQSIIDGQFQTFVTDVLTLHFPNKHIPSWVYEALDASDSIDIASTDFVNDPEVLCAADVHVRHELVHQEAVDPDQKGIQGVHSGEIRQPVIHAKSHARQVHKDAGINPHNHDPNSTSNPASVLNATTTPNNS